MIVTIVGWLVEMFQSWAYFDRIKTLHFWFLTFDLDLVSRIFGYLWEVLICFGASQWQKMSGYYNDLRCTSPTFVECHIVTAESTGGSIPADNKVKTLKNIKVRLQSMRWMFFLNSALSRRLAGIHRWRKLLEAGVWCTLGERMVKETLFSRSRCFSQGLLCSWCLCDVFVLACFKHIYIESSMNE